MKCTYWQQCGPSDLIGCCHHPQSRWKHPSLQLCTKICKIRVDGEPMPPAWPRPKVARSSPPPSLIAHHSSGPGTELKKLLTTVGITDSSCNCRSHVSEMDHHGPDWCYENLDTIVGWLQQEAKKRNLPFLALAVRMLVLRAIAMARQNKKLK